MRRLSRLAGAALTTAPLRASAGDGSDCDGGSGFGRGVYDGGAGLEERGLSSFDDSFLESGEQRNGQPA
ncbi:hypothetical protein [Paraburkholderia elongata]|uniref:Uncharacterized protein n=1 Tax=Paraburkholderia elongata TaxID=2675747 RepID=A0A972NMJ1_9BURK|nr:hypothetical protein [Paraburkholderia elongata]NPT55028.1 hypothetical protein [Paraburkholderia elongata]